MTETQLGELETAVMGVVWQQGQATVQDVKTALAPERELAYTTIMTVMTRLADKGVLTRHKEGRAYVYTATNSQEKVAGSLLRSLVQRFYGGVSAHAIAHLLAADEAVADEELARLEKLIQAKREEKRA